MSLRVLSLHMLVMQACTNSGKKAEAVQHMEALAAAKVVAGGPSALRAMQQAGTSLEPRLQVDCSTNEV